LSKKNQTQSEGNCFICGDGCTMTNISDWVELWYMGRKERRVKACKKHEGVEAEFKRQQEEM
jgi:hypothetical protein